ncbi:NAD(P)-binding protein [Niastella sp. OAS944]|uniref:NAD(P)-binding protein n=1 Tax=Niastella sp. OAS944 TaxID=2664089 RepID=UPI0034756D87|nr:protoporphyrinogen oxidase [Chitinophagaceae bacterium OAS944]
MGKKAIIIGAGPAGLTAAYELLKRTDIKPIILEKSGDIGGISKTINYKGNRMDIGGHRFFSKSDRVMNWWLNIMPVQPNVDTYTTITYQRKHRTIKQEEAHSRLAPEDESKMMLIRKRLSRIYFLRKFFTYPIQLSIDTLQKLGAVRTLGILISYLKAQLFPRKPEKSLEDFLINRFGVKLYLLFFKDYTEKVWGVPCNEISAEWGAQRIKGVSISKAIQHAAQTMMKKKKSSDIAQKNTETSLIEQFLYPALGPGQLWEEVARQVQEMGGIIIMHESVKKILTSNNKVTGVITEIKESGVQTEYTGDYFFSTMPVQELIAGMNGQVPSDVKEIAAGLQYRDFITIGILLKKLTSINSQKILPDTWIYIQERDVKVGRLQIFNNWSPYMVKDPNTVWLGMEYFCNEGDAFWSLTNEEIERTAVEELEKMGLAKVEDVLDSTVQRMEKTYPAYFGTYNQFDKVKEYTDRFENLFLVGRNGMHKYNNSDHSMLTAMVSVDNICAGVTSKGNIWEINTEQEYHEEKSKDNNHINNNNEPNISSNSNEMSVDNDITDSKRTNKPTASFPELESVVPFKAFLYNDKRNRIYLYCSAIAIIIQFAVFKYFYPFASFINGDSYVYLETAYQNLSINTYPVGYSNFLRLFSVFTKSDLILVAFQYLLLNISLLVFLFTIFYFYKPGKPAQIFLLAFLILNPVFLYLSNYVSSDTLFLALSLMWLTQLIWIIHRPTTKLIIWNGLILFCVFTIRYNAMYYPIIAGIAFLLSKQKWWMKIAGPAIGVALIGLFVLYTGNQYKKLTGVWQFSPFSGWQLANNAMYAYRYVDKADRTIVPTRLREIDKMISTYFDTTKDLKRFPHEKMKASTVYMWTPGLPLQKYMVDHSKNDTSKKDLKRWAAVGPLYSGYGSYIIRKHPLAFLQYYIWPNAVKFYAPPVEFLEQYSTGKDSVAPIAQQWFGYKSRKITSRFKDFDVQILDFLPIMAGMLHIVFLFGLMGYLMFQGYKKQPWLNKAILLVTTFWLLNFGFSVFASPIALRFQLFPIIVSIAFACLFIEYIIKVARQHETNYISKEVGHIQFSA